MSRVQCTVKLRKLTKSLLDTIAIGNNLEIKKKHVLSVACTLSSNLKNNKDLIDWTVWNNLVFSLYLLCISFTFFIDVHSLGTEEGTRKVDVVLVGAPKKIHRNYIAIVSQYHATFSDDENRWSMNRNRWWTVTQVLTDFARFLDEPAYGSFWSWRNIYLCCKRFWKVGP